VLLGSHPERNDLITIGTSAPGEPLPDLDDQDMQEGTKPTAAGVKKEVERFLEHKGVEPGKKRPAKPANPARADDRAMVRAAVVKLEAELGRFVPTEDFRPLLEQLLQLIDRNPSDGDAPVQDSADAAA